MRLKAAHLAIALTLGLLVAAAPAMAQDPSPAVSPSAICGLLTLDEIATAFKADLPVTSADDSSCSWDSYASSGSAQLSVSFTSGALDDLATAYPDATKDEIAGVPVLIGSDGSFLFAAVNGGILSVFAFVYDEAVDVPTVVRSLSEAALGRMSGIELPPEPSARPQPSFVGDAELQALFPTSVLGQPMESQTISGQELAAQVDPTDEQSQAEFQALVDALSAHGKTLDDLSVGFAFAYSAEVTAALTAVRIHGVAIDEFTADLLPLLLTDITDPVQAQTTVAGKAVTMITDGPDSPDSQHRYAYPKDDVLWIVQADEPALTDLFNQLP